MNLSKYKYKRFILLILISIFILFSLPSNAQEEFVTDVRATFDVDEEGLTTITHEITLENVFTTLYAENYQFIIKGSNPEDIKVYRDKVDLDFETVAEGNTIALNITFPEARVGRGKTREFTIEYKDSNLANRTGEVWEISVPKLEKDDNFDSYSLELLIPNIFGEEAFVAPTASTKYVSSRKTSYTFEKEQLTKAGVSAAFGKFQVFSLNLTYHLENPLTQKAELDITLPPDTAFQKAIYESITPNPQSVKVDPDGNWIATYILKPRESINVVAKANVQVFSVPRPFTPVSQETLERSTKPTNKWQTEDPLVKSLASKHKTPKQIYDYITENFTYNYERVTPNVKRLGAVEALNNPSLAICMEFTDAFIALARANGIPAREINGFAYTQNPQLQPLSLVADVLHAWPEYWDASKNTWIPVDPTWGNTTGGTDYFSKLDLRHIVFAIHGESSELPHPAGSYNLGSEPQKDVFVKISSLPQDRAPKANLAITGLSGITPSKRTYEAVIINDGPVAIYEENVSVYFDQQQIITSELTLPPFGNDKINIEIPVGLFGRSAPDQVTLNFLGKKKIVEINKNSIAIVHLTLIGLVVFALIGTSLYFLKKKS